MVNHYLGLDSEAKITKHIKDFMNDDLNSWDDSDLYDGFDEEVYRITQNDNL